MAENESSDGSGGGVGVSYIELDRERISAEEMLQVEQACNDAIREAVQVEVKTFEAGDPQLSRVCIYPMPLFVSDLVFCSEIENWSDYDVPGEHQRPPRGPQGLRQSHSDR